MSLKPINGKLQIQEFFDYILENYIEKDSSFPPTIWVEYTIQVVYNDQLIIAVNHFKQVQQLLLSSIPHIQTSFNSWMH